MRERRFRPIHLLLAALGGGLLTALAGILAAYLILGPQCFAFVEAWGIVETRFVGEYDKEEALTGALTGLVDSLGDRWSYAMSADGYTALQQRRSNSYVGVGITITYNDERGLAITAVQPGSSAEAGGLRAGDLVVAVDGTSLAGEGRWNGPDLIQGEEGTAVTLTILGLDGQERQVELERVAVPVEPVESKMLEGQVGYIRLKNFHDHSAEKLNAAVDDLVDQGAVALIFDMRNNEGGYVTQLTDMLKHILPAGPVFRLQGALREEVYEAEGEGIGLPMAVLVNKDTYSAAELFAAQCKESAGAYIVGEETCGKGYSQQTFRLSTGAAINISTSRYTTGGGVSLVGTGVDLDAQLSLSEEDALALQNGTLAVEEDEQLQKALELLGKQ